MRPRSGPCPSFFPRSGHVPNQHLPLTCTARHQGGPTPALSVLAESLWRWLLARGLWIFARHLAHNVKYVETSFASGVIEFGGVDGREILAAIRAAVRAASAILYQRWASVHSAREHLEGSRGR